MQKNQDHPPREGARTRPADRPVRLDAAVLFRSHHEVEILHAGTVYRLRLTKGGKLLLTK
ncbi:MAG: hemin uptake protein HemP [Rhodovarius sp.]|nr:hemin uptake protein HemP [Rhodovarius sp.]MDW8314301.1 hemin uptake protein HemP [Rhodovarius sp.]